MKKIFVVLILLITFNGFGQTFKKPTKGKALVYIIRGNSIGNGYNIRVYDGKRFLGPLPGRAYFTYECEPGEHLFWAASENRDFVEANLSANKIYVIDLRAKLGLVHMAVGVEPYTPSNPKHLKRFKKAINKHINAVIYGKERSDEKKENIEKAFKSYKSIKNNRHSKIKKLTSDMSFSIDNF